MKALYRIAAALLVSMLAPGFAAGADRLVLTPGLAADGLPELPGRPDNSGWTMRASEEETGLQYKNDWEKWAGEITTDSSDRPLLRLGHARRLSDKLGAGTLVVRDGDTSEVLLNALYRPRPRMHLRFSAMQRRVAPGDASTEYLSYLVGLRKTWRRSAWKSAGLTWHVMESSSRTATPGFGDDSLLPYQSDEVHAADESDRTRVLSLDLSLAPAPRSRLELRHEHYLVAQEFNGTSNRYSGTHTRVSYRQQFENCTELSGEMVASDDRRDLALRIGRHNWHVRGGQDLSGNDRYVMIGYAIPLGASRKVPTCDGGERQQMREAMVDALTAMPDEFG